MDTRIRRAPSPMRDTDAWENSPLSRLLNFVLLYKSYLILNGVPSIETETAKGSLGM